ASFKACHAVAILDHNEGLLRLPEKLRDFYIPLSENDIKNIEKLALVHDFQRSRNLKNTYSCKKY
ncbi:342_t:CDS:1, partial [Entrophospora sp. SA101]